MSAVRVSTVEDVASILRLRADASTHLVGIDGFMGSGKTTLAFAVAELLDGFRVSLDSYIDRNVACESYRAKLLRHYLASDLRKLSSKFKFVIVEGICLLDALAMISSPPDSLVYVRRLSSSTGIWHDGFHLKDYENASSPMTEGLSGSELQYHSTVRPHERADVIYERREEA